MSSGTPEFFRLLARATMALERGERGCCSLQQGWGWGFCAPPKHRGVAERCLGGTGDTHPQAGQAGELAVERGEVVVAHGEMLLRGEGEQGLSPLGFGVLTCSPPNPDPDSWTRFARGDAERGRQRGGSEAGGGPWGSFAPPRASQIPLRASGTPKKQSLAAAAYCCFFFFFEDTRAKKPHKAPPFPFIKGQRSSEWGFCSGLLRNQGATPHGSASAPLPTSPASHFSHTPQLSPIIRGAMGATSPGPPGSHQLLEGGELLGQVAEPRAVQLQPAQAAHRLHVLREVATL